MTSCADQVRGDTFAALISALGIERNDRLSTQLDFRAGTHGSFSANLEDGTWKDFESGQGGGVLDLVVRQGAARDRAEAARWIEEQGFARGSRARRGALKPRELNATGDALDRRRMAEQLWGASRPIHADDLAGRYLARARALPGPWPSSLRYANAAYCGPLRSEAPALVAGVSMLDSPGEIIAVQRIFLETPGRKHSGLPSPKMSLGSIAGGGVLFGDLSDMLIVAEDVESALSVQRRFEQGGVNVAAVATLGAGNMQKLIVPSCVQHLVIAPDRDASGVGHRAARALAKRVASRVPKVSLCWPPDGLNDWNDWLKSQTQAQGAEGAHV